MTETLTDPQLTAFYAGDPAQLDVPAEVAEPDERRRALELAIAAATYAAVKITRDKLAARFETVDTAHAAAREAWAQQLPGWVKMILPAVLRLYELEHAVVPQAELEAVAASYVTGLGQYVGDSSADALQTGLAQQVTGGWAERMAWQRSAAAFGLDARDMRTYITRSLAATVTNPDKVIVQSARTFADKALLIRADLLGRSEAWSAMESGKALLWMYAQQAGGLPADAMREWDTAEDESTCSICAPFDGQQVGLQDRFIVAGRHLWAPQAHPGCRCHVKLVMPEEELAKAQDPNEHPRGQPANAGQYRLKIAKPVIRLAEQEPEPVDPVVAQMLADATAYTAAEVAPIAEQAPTLTEIPTLVTRPTLTAIPTLSAGLRARPTLTAPPTLTRPTLAGPTLQTGTLNRDEAHAARREADRTTNRLIVVIPQRERPPRPGEEVYVSTDEYNQAMRRKRGREYKLGEVVNFAPAQHDRWHGTVRADTFDPWYAPDIDVMLAKRQMDTDPGQREEQRRQWDSITAKAWTLFHHALTLHKPILGNLSDAELAEIMSVAGEPPGPNLTRTDRIDAIATAVRNLQQGARHDPLGEAYGDYVVWQQPEIIDRSSPGKNGYARGKQFGVDLDQLDSVGMPFTREPYEQVFKFHTNDVYEGDHRTRSDGLTTKVVPFGVYQVVERDYRSGLWQSEGAPDLLHIGLGTLHMAPMPNGWHNP